MPPYSKKSVGPIDAATASKLIDQRIAELDDWRGEALARVRRLIRAADAGVVEEWKWGGPVWSCDGIICTGETYKAAVKLTFPKGASLADPARLFNSSLEGATRRALDIPKGASPDEAAFKALIREAIAANRGGSAPKKPEANRAPARKTAVTKSSAKKAGSKRATPTKTAAKKK